jgi:hypothetical protein
MTRVVLLIGFLAFFIFLGLTLIFPLCTWCAALLVGAGAGWLAVLWSRPRDEGDAARTGALAAALSGIGALLGQTAGGVLNAVLVGPEGATQLMEGLGITALDTSSASGAGYYAGAIGGQACCGLLNVGTMAGLGALAAFLYQKYSGRNRDTLVDDYP